MIRCAKAGAELRRIRERYRATAHMRPRLKGWRAYANLLRGYYECQRGATTLKSRPVKLIFDPTNACQLACPLCPTGLGMIDRGRGHADIRLFEQLMEQVGDYLFLVDFYNWGDPLLNRRLEDFIRIASRHRVMSTVSSNLSLRLSDERIERLLTSGVNEILISLDGASRETHTRYRRNSDFDLICSNIRRLVQARVRLGQTEPLLTWQFVVFAFNEHEIERAQAMAVAFGVDRIIFRPPFLQTERFAMSDADRAEIATWSPRDTRFHQHIATPSKRRRCGWHYTAVAVNWDGSVTPCSTAFRQADDFGTFGKAGEQRYMDVVNNDRFQAARGFFVKAAQPDGESLCARCPTPSIQTYHRFVYRRIALVTGVALAETVRRGCGMAPRQPEAVAQQSDGLRSGGHS